MCVCVCIYICKQQKALTSQTQKTRQKPSAINAQKESRKSPKKSALILYTMRDICTTLMGTSHSAAQRNSACMCT